MIGLEEAVRTLRDAGISGWIWVGGSFMTRKPEPRDVDAVILLSGTDYDRITDSQRAVVDAMTDPMWWSVHRCDLFIVLEYPPAHRNHLNGELLKRHWQHHFGHSRRKEPKGIAVLRIE